MFIRIENGQPVGHPILAENFRQAYPNLDPTDPANGFAEFIRIARQDVGKYKVILSGPTYEWVGDAVQDIWETRDMTPEERAEVDQLSE